MYLIYLYYKYNYRRSATVAEHEWTEEYDYVRLESRSAVGRRNAEIRAALPDKLRASFDALVRDADHAGEVHILIYFHSTD